MGIGDSLKKMIDIEELEDDEITEEELEAERKRMAGQASNKETIAEKSAPVRSAEKYSAPGTKATPSSSKPERRFTITSSTSFKLVLLEPKSFDECPRLVDSLKSKKPVIINLERIDMEVARKIFDFLSGATYALNGNVQKVANNIFIFAPANVDIAGSITEEPASLDFSNDNRAEKSESPWR